MKIVGRSTHDYAMIVELTECECTMLRRLGMSLGVHEHDFYRQGKSGETVDLSKALEAIELFAESLEKWNKLVELIGWYKKAAQ